MPTYLRIFLMKSAVQAFTEKKYQSREETELLKMVLDTAVGALKLKRNAWEKRKEQEEERTDNSNCGDSLSKIVIKQQVAK